MYLMIDRSIHRQLLRPWIVHPSITSTKTHIQETSPGSRASNTYQQRQPGIDRPTLNDGGRGVSGAGPHGPRAGGLCRPGHLHAGALIDALRAGGHASDGWDGWMGLRWWGKSGGHPIVNHVSHCVLRRYLCVCRPPPQMMNGPDSGQTGRSDSSIHHPSHPCITQPNTGRGAGHRGQAPRL